jgi:hypothetical protein
MIRVVALLKARINISIYISTDMNISNYRNEDNIFLLLCGFIVVNNTGIKTRRHFRNEYDPI